MLKRNTGIIITSLVTAINSLTVCWTVYRIVREYVYERIIFTHFIELYFFGVKFKELISPKEF